MSIVVVGNLSYYLTTLGTLSKMVLNKLVGHTQIFNDMGMKV